MTSAHNEIATLESFTQDFITNKCNTISEFTLSNPKKRFNFHNGFQMNCVMIGTLQLLFKLAAVKGARSDCFRFFSNFQRFWYQKKACIFLITPGEFYSWKMYCLEDINENVTNENATNETKISWVVMHHLNKNLHSEKSDQAPLNSIPKFNLLNVHIAYKDCFLLSKWLPCTY